MKEFIEIGSVRNYIDDKSIDECIMFFNTLKEKYGGDAIVDIEEIESDGYERQVIGYEIHLEVGDYND